MTKSKKRYSRWLHAHQAFRKFMPILGMSHFYLPATSRMKTSFYSILIAACFVQCKGQQPFGTELLKLEKEIQMPGVRGRIDHIAVNLSKKLLYVAALGNNTVEVLSLDDGKTLASIKNIEEPQGVVFLPAQNEIAVASGGSGDCFFFNATTFEKTAAIHLDGDADNIRYDAVNEKLYVGYGNGGIAIIDPLKHALLKELTLPAHPEGFQLDMKLDRLYVNLPDAGSIAVVALPALTLADTWKTGRFKANFPMAIDTANNLVYAAFRHAPSLVSFDVLTGRQAGSVGMVDDVDDIFFDPRKQEIYATGGGGYINIFRKKNRETFDMVAAIPTRSGARTSLLVPSLNIFIVAERAADGQPAGIAVYSINH
jgi:DNA-binding beta-propeller fold protein YncE